MSTAREKFKFQNTLLCLLKGLEGRRVVVELRNEHSVVGRLEHVDWLMNTSMANAQYTTANGRTTRFDQFYIQGRNIRFVQIPDNVDIIATIDWELKKFQRGRGGGGAKREKWIVKLSSKQKLKRKLERTEQMLRQRLQDIDSHNAGGPAGPSTPGRNTNDRGRPGDKDIDKR